MENSNNLIKAENGCVKMTRIHNEAKNDSMSQVAKIQSFQSNLGLGDRPPFRDQAKQFLDYEERSSFVSLESRIKRKLDKLARRAKEYPLDDSGNTDFVCDILGDNIYYDSIVGQFMIYNGIRWMYVDNAYILRIVERCMNCRRDSILASNSASQDMFKHAMSCSDHKSLKAVREILKCRVVLDDETRLKFDSVPYLLNVANGTIDLRTGELKEHKRKDYITQVIPLEYHPDAPAKRFKLFLREVFLGVLEDIDYVQKAFGYSITGETCEQCLFFLFGNGSNGKSTLGGAIMYVIKDYASIVSAHTFVRAVARPDAPTPELAQLVKSRFVTCSEWNESDVLDEGKVKMLTGGSEISVRKLFGEPFSYAPKFKVFLDTNYLPHIHGGDYGIWRRIRLIPFYASFTKKKKIDLNLSEKLKNEAEGILAWLVEGAVKYYAEGLKEPRNFKDAYKAYKRFEDAIGSFLDECVEYSEGEEISANKLYEAYLEYCSFNNCRVESQTVFGRRMSKTKYVKHKKSSGYVYLGAKLAR